ncbi:hypothetical protein HYW87_03965, partial [Candidatus Roizmanbacteria bacterium]|nr:hypothetical protein [Candidatus Roizmanbacteria bacterium]
KLPQEKVFIDGRMPSWRQKKSETESEYAFGEYNSLFQPNPPIAKVFKKYDIDTVLLPTAFLDKKEFIKELKKNQFKEVYRDQTAIVYSQKNTSNHWR